MEARQLPWPSANLKSEPMLIGLWHSWLDMKKYDLQWHKDDLSDEMRELQSETEFVARWSEYSDIAYTYTRASWSGHKLDRPISLWHFVFGLVYMFPKYTLRWLFFRWAGRKLGVEIREVRNPRKQNKLATVAERYTVDPEKFVEVCQNQLRYWPLLK